MNEKNLRCQLSAHSTTALLTPHKAIPFLRTAEYVIQEIESTTYQKYGSTMAVGGLHGR